MIFLEHGGTPSSEVDPSEFFHVMRGIGSLGFANILVNLNGIILLPVLSKTLSVSDYGIWVQLTVTLGLLLLATTLGLPSGFVRYFAAVGNKKDIQKGFFSMAAAILLTTSVASVIFYYFSPVLASSLFGGSIFVAKTLPLILIFLSFNIFFLSYFLTFQRIRAYALLYLAQTYLMVGLVTVAVLGGRGLNGAVLGYLLAQVVMFLVMVGIIFSEIGVKMPSFSHIRKYLSFSLPLVQSDIFQWVVNVSDRYVITLLLGIVYVGYYSPGYTLGAMLSFVMYPFTTLLPVHLSSYHDHGEDEKVASILKYSFKYFMLAAIPCVFGISALSKAILQLLSTPEIAAHGYFITPFTAASMLLYGLTGLYTLPLLLEKKTRYIAVGTTSAAIVNLSVNIAIVPYLGILGAAISTLAAFAVSLTIIAFFSSKYFSPHFDWVFVIRSGIASLPTLFIIAVWNPTGVIGVIACIAVCASAYLAGLLALRGIRIDELTFIFKALVSRRQA